MPRSQAEARLLGQLAVETSWSNTTDRASRTAAARAALDAKFLAEADGDPQRAEHLRRAYFHRLALKSVTSRRLAREARDRAVAMTRAAELAEAELQAAGGGGE